MRVTINIGFARVGQEDSTTRDANFRGENVKFVRMDSCFINM